MKIATTTGDLRFCYPEDKSIAAPLDGFVETPFRHLDLSFYSILYKDSPWILPGDLWKREVEDAARKAEKFGFDFVQSHAPDGPHFREGDKDSFLSATHRVIEACSMLGIPNTVMHAEEFGQSQADFDAANIGFYARFEDDCEKFGVEMLAENSSWKWCPGYYLRNGEEMRDFIRKAGLPMLHLNWDTGHGHVEGCNQFDDILAMGGELHALHVQDNFGDLDSHVMPYAGTTNFDDVMSALRDVGYHGCFTFEGGNTLRRSGVWPNFRVNDKSSDKFRLPPLRIQQKQISVMFEIGKWFLESYGFTAE